MRWTMPLLALLAACSANDLTDVNGPLSFTVPQTAVAPGVEITGVVANRTRVPFSTYVELPCGQPFERKVGGTWTSLGSSDSSVLCLTGAMYQELGPDSTWNYSWRAPSDTGTYRVVLSIGLLITLISHPIVVR